MMDSGMIQLRSFVHQRLFSAAEEILGEVERTVTLALYEAEVSRSKEEVESLQHQLDLLRHKPAAEPSLTSSTVERGDGCDAPLLQENPGPSTQEEPNFSLSAEVPGPSQTSADPDSNNCRMSEIKEEQEEHVDDSQTQEMVFPSLEIVKIEQDPPETQISYEMPPVSSKNCSEAQSENNDSDEEWVNSKGEQTKTMKMKGKILQSGSVNEKDKVALPYDKSSAKSGKDRSFCHLCGKGFQYVGSLMNHIKAHEKKIDCSVCGKTYKFTKELIAHLKSCHNKTYFCAVCGETFANIRCLQLHEVRHSTGMKEFVCQECGKTFSLKGHLVVHVRTHSGEKPYVCDVCGKGFSQSQSLTIHKRSHSGEKPYQCDLCGKRFNTLCNLKVHIKRHTGEKKYACNICGKSFSQRANMISHMTTHSGERPYGCHTCGMRYRFPHSLKAHLKTHEKAAAE
ncbi:zinc finger protein OZF-like [Sebastes umbrosus]|uniref:zinc finger protein OZF-like n=1 Tax=Sebastes umbrosus TaxID=72105 RepID=UPI00189DE093|nr:zinc finger protein OZF-like [Sebastes umbrosus]